jgi:hypothetical protein
MRIRTVGRILLQDGACVDLILPVVRMLLLIARWRAVQLLVGSDGRLIRLVVVCIVVVFGIECIVARRIMMLRVVAVAVAVTRNVLY